MPRNPDTPVSEEKQSSISHPIPPVWNSESQVLILGTMPSPKSREAGFFYMHPQNRFWSVMTEIFGETLAHPNNSAAITERRDFLLRHHLAMWDVLSSCEITGAADSSIKNAIPNDFTETLNASQIHHIICTGKTAYNLWQKKSAVLYEPRYNLTVHCLPSTSPANDQWSKERLINEYKPILSCYQSS